MRTGAEYVRSLNDGREVYVNGERVEDVARHPAFAGVVDTIAGMYDFAREPSNDMIFVAPETGREANKVFMTPRSREDLAVRRAAITAWSDLGCGFVGRSPDHVGAFLSGFASASAVFDRKRNLSSNVTSFYKRLLDESLYVSYAIIPPQTSRVAKGDQAGDLLQVGVVEEREDGIVVRGSQMLATAAAIGDEILISCLKPLADTDTDFAISFVLPIATPGMRFYCRRPYALDQPSTYDYPLSTRFDESDSLVVFDDVLVPWERIFVDRDVQGVREQFFSTGAHILGNSQAQIRLVSKLKFLLGIARKVTQANGIDRIPQVQESLGELASLASLVEGAVLAAEYASELNDYGVCIPASRYVYGAMGQQATLYPRVLHIIRELVGGGVLQIPSSIREMTNETTRADMDRYLRSPDASSEERVKLFKLAWDAIGSEFAGRHHQYEMFYAGAPFVAKGYAFRGYDFAEALDEVEAFLGSYSVESSA